MRKNIKIMNKRILALIPLYVISILSCVGLGWVILKFVDVLSSSEYNFSYSEFLIFGLMIFFLLFVYSTAFLSEYLLEGFNIKDRLWITYNFFIILLTGMVISILIFL